MSKIIQLPKPFVLKPYSKKELSILMEVSPYILTKWLKAIEPIIGKPTGRTYNIKQVEIIIDTYGLPGKIMEEAA
jgi:hypothetical protein